VIDLKEILWRLFMLFFCYYYQRVLFLLVVLLTLFQVTGDNPEEAIVKVIEGNR
jgi:hypothetical protein